MENIIEFKNTNFAYNNTNAFNDFNMEIQEGDMVSLIGTSGSGKTTLLKMLCHKLPNDSVYYKGKAIKSYDVKDLQRDIIVIFDTPLHCNTVLEEITQYAKKLSFTEDLIYERITELYKTIDLESIENSDPRKLPREKQYLIKLLRYLILKPKFVAIDCMTTNLNQVDKKKVFDYIKHYKITLLNVTNDLNETLYGNKLYVLENFVLILEGTTLSVLKTDTLLKRLGFKLPLPVDLSIELSHYEVLKKLYTDNDKLVNALWK